jgi:outer membrane protein OmpA-like peptidoglycan-associated protein
MALSLVGAAYGDSDPAQANDPFPIEEGFEHGAFGGSEWRDGGSAELTAGTDGEGNGWLRLTKAEASEFGYVYYNEAFPSTDGALVEFEYADYGGDGADGLTFFLYDGSVSEGEFHAGYRGGALGYASCTEGASEHPGVSKAYIGVGFDEYGNFTNLGAICALDGTEMHPDHVSVRGSEEEKYRLLGGAESDEGLMAERAHARHVTVSVTSEDKLSVYIRYPDGTQQAVVEGLQLPQSKLPPTFKFGFAASTGGLTDFHEIRQAKAVKPTELVASASKTGGGHERGEPLTWTATVRNEGPNPTQAERVSASTGEQSLSNVTWTCSATENGSHEKAQCGTTSGSGLPTGLSGGSMPIGTRLEYDITGKPTTAASYAQMTLETQPTGDTGELDPERETATATTNLTPLFTSQPSFTLTSGGQATATAGTVIGRELSTAYRWQMCEADGTDCANIAGASELTYHTTAADRGHTIRFQQAATNSAAETIADSSPYEPLPIATITEAPPAFASVGAAKLKFTTEAAEATFECSRDGGAWETCVSPKEYSGLGEGRHTFAVRAVRGGLSAATPPSAEWNVEPAPPPAPTITAEPSSPSALTDPVFAFGNTTAGDALQCDLDGRGWVECAQVSGFPGLVNGGHLLEVRELNRAGVPSEAAAYSWIIDTTAPPAPRITSAPPSPSPQRNSAFTLGGLEGGDTLECRLDGGEWSPCSASTQFAIPDNGEHLFEARQVSRAGVTSPPASYRWTIDTTPPPPPAVLTAPEAETTRRTGHFKFTHEPGATVRCSIDGRPYTDCTSGLDVSHLRNGPHTVTVRQISAAGVVSKPSTYRWRVVHRLAGKRRIGRHAKGHAGHSRKRATQHLAPKRTGASPSTGAEHRSKRPSEHPPTGRPKRPQNAKLRHPPTPKVKRLRAPSAPRGARSSGGSEQLTPEIGERVTVSPNLTLEVGCRVRHARLRACAVRAYHEVDGHSLEIGRGHVTLSRGEHGGGALPLLLNTTGQRLLAGRLNGLPTALKVRAETVDARDLSAPLLDVRLYPQNVHVLPIVWPFQSGRSALVGRARRIVEKVAKEIGQARQVTCIGYTDSEGARSYNVALARRRAQAVCSALQTLGVQNAFKLETQGAARPRASNRTSAGRALNRRVELLATY